MILINIDVLNFLNVIFQKSDMNFESLSLMIAIETSQFAICNLSRIRCAHCSAV